jgi:isopropylmalate/homocitrate/citramalate synthase
VRIARPLQLCRNDDMTGEGRIVGLMTASNVTLCDVGPRDGLQNESDVVVPARRAELANRLAATGLPRIEAASFVSPNRVPQMAGAEEVAAALHPTAETTFSGLVLNERGYERLLRTGLSEVHFSFGATETFNRCNSNASVAEGVQTAVTLASRSRADRLRLSVTISVAFGCPFEGRVDPARVADVAEQVVAGGADEVVLADTIGVATPTHVRRLVERVAILGRPVGVHLHDTRNTALAGAMAALEAGATVFDASVGGIGGCPYAPGATGNVSTEDLVYLLDGEGVETGVDLEALIDAARWLAALLGRPLPGSVYRAGPFRPAAAAA